MDSQADQRWGRPLEQYLASHTLVAHKERGLVRRETEEEAELVKEAMYGQILNAHGPIPGAGDFLGADDITVPMLETVLRLAHSPHHLHFFADPVFIGGCIRLLAQIRPWGLPSPFSHELGYLCFKIIAIGIGAWILKMTERLDTAIQKMEADNRTEPLVIFSGEVSRILRQVMIDAVWGKSCDWIMGWTRTRGHMDPERFILPSDLRNLLSILWEDRKLYLQVFMSTYLPGLSGVVFVLWRYLDVNPASESSRPTKLMSAPFCEVLWRSMLVATPDQFAVLTLIDDFDRENQRVDLWEKSPKYVNLEDSNTLIQAFASRVTPDDLRFNQPLPLGIASVLLRFVTLSVQPGSADLFPALFVSALEYLWDAVEWSDWESARLIAVAGDAFALLNHVIKPLNHSNCNHAVVERLAAVLEQHDFLELLARLILLLKPAKANSRSNPTVSRNTRFINNTLSLVGNLARISSAGGTLGYQFKRRIDDWSKMNFRLSMIELLGPSRVPKLDKALHAQRTELWANISRLLGFGPRAATLIAYKCSYPRCPYGNGVLPVEFACARCQDCSYCSTQCQRRDWTLDHGGGSHRQLCVAVPQPLVQSDGAVIL